MGDYAQLTAKKFLDSTGTGHLWDRIRERFDAKLDRVVATNDSIAVVNNNSISVVVSADEDNLLQLKNSGNKGLYVPAPAPADTYAVVRAAESGDYAAVYQLMKYTNGTGAGQKVGVDINIPKDMVVQSGRVENKSQSGTWGPAGTYIILTLANAESTELYILVDNLIEYVTSGSQQGDMVVININSQHQVTATISDGTIPASKLTSQVQAQIAHGAAAVLSVTEGSTNGTILVDGVEVPVHGLGTAAFTAATAYDAAGAASAVLGTNADTASTMTVYGTKQYTSDAYVAITALTSADIDAIISGGEPEPGPGPSPEPGPTTPTDENGNIITDENGNSLEFDVPNT